MYFIYVHIYCVLYNLSTSFNPTPPPVHLKPGSLHHGPPVIRIVVPWHRRTVVWVRLVSSGHIQTIPVVYLAHHVVVPPHHDDVIVWSASIYTGHNWRCWCGSVARLHMGNSGIGTDRPNVRLVEPQGRWCPGLITESIRIRGLVASIAKVVHSTGIVSGAIVVGDLEGSGEEITDQGYVDDPQEEAPESDAHHDASSSLGGQ